MKIVYVTPHLSTGGMPEYLRKKIELLKDENQIWVIELVTEMAYRIQRDKIQKMIGDNLIPVNKNYQKVLDIITEIQPDVLHFEELSDYHIPEPILDKIYVPDRKYKIFETFHDSSIDSYEKKFVPDKMLVVSPWQHKMMMELGVPIEIINHEITAGERDRNKMEKLGIDPNKKHVMQVGLFSRRKNQSETFDIARKMPDVQFHFLGGQTENYKFYWEPLLQNKPDNCIIWGERNDVYSFYQCLDAVIFPSRGQYGDRETNPLVIREADAWQIPILVRDLPIYMGMYRESERSKFMSDDINENVKFLYGLLNMKQRIEEIEYHPRDDFRNNFINDNFFKKKLFNITFDPENNKINFEYLESIDLNVTICVRDIDTEIPIYSFDANFKQGSNFWCIPIPKPYYNFQENPNFGGFLYEFYDITGNRIYFSSQRLKRTSFQKDKLRIESFDPIFVNFEQFFTDKIYDDFFKKIDTLENVVDVGASVGLFTELVLRKGAKNVISLEINNKAISVFEDIHKEKDNVKLIKKALYNHNGEIEIFMDTKNSLISSVNSSNINGGYSDHFYCITLDDLIKENNLDTVDLIKIDIEGAEYDIFKELSIETLSKIKFILLEFHNNYGSKLSDDILSKLKDAGFDYEIYQDDCIGKADYYEERGTIFAERIKIQ